jgi:predicted metal-dependent phosphoesterase TrpH
MAISELVDLYGTSGFDVLCITDHVGRSGPEWQDSRWRITGTESFADYLGEIEQEAWRADLEHGLILVPGLELTYDDREPARAAHAVAVGLRTFVSLDQGLVPALTEAREAGAALIAAHPYPPDEAQTAHRGTGAWAAEGRSAAHLVDRYELVNRRDVFAWVMFEGLPGVATGDFHRPEHLWTWKTLLPCVESETAVVRYLRSDQPAYLVDLAEPARIPVAA